MNVDARNLVIEPEQLNSLLSDRDDLIIVDLCQKSVYAQVHVPGAIHVDPSELTSGQQPTPGKLPSEERINALFSKLASVMTKLSLPMMTKEADGLGGSSGP